MLLCTTCDIEFETKEGFPPECFERNHEIIEYGDDVTNSLDPLTGLIEIIEKTVKDDQNLIYHILFNGLSAFTDNPTHLMIMEKTSEGKTYPAIEVSNYFPKENVMILSSATPQTFKYERGILVNDKYEPIQEQLDQLNEKINSEKTDKAEASKLKKERQKLLTGAKYLIDLRHKWIIFKEPPDNKLLEMLYSTLSADQEYSEHKLVNKSSSGSNQMQTVVIRGTPAILICTARDETRARRWEETFSRFDITSPKISSEKYRHGMDLIGQKIGLPRFLYDEQVITETDKRKARKLVKILIDNIKKSNGEIFNPFIDGLSEVFPQESGKRWRQRIRFETMLKMHCFCYVSQRPHLIRKDRKIPIATLNDVKFVSELSLTGETLPPHKASWFNTVFLPAWKTKSEELNIPNEFPFPVITGNQIKEYCETEGKGPKTSTKMIRETYLETLYDFGLIEKNKDPRNKTRDVYWPITESYQSPSIAISSFDASCVNSCLDKYLKRRFRFEFMGMKIEQDKLVTEIVGSIPENKAILDNDETTIDDDLENEISTTEQTITNDDERRQTTINDEKDLAIQEEKYAFQCFKCNERGSGPFRVKEDSKILVNCKRFHPGSIKYLTKQEYEADLERQGHAVTFVKEA